MVPLLYKFVEVENKLMSHTLEKIFQQSIYRYLIFIKITFVESCIEFPNHIIYEYLTVNVL